MQENDYQAIHDRIRGNLSSPEMRAAVRDDYAVTLKRFGMSLEDSTALADEIVCALEDGDTPLREIEHEVYEQFKAAPASSHFRRDSNLAETFSEALERRAGAFSGQVLLQLGDLPQETTSVLNVSRHNEPLKQDKTRFHVIEAEDTAGVIEPFNVAVLNNVLHHETPERANDIIWDVTEKGSTRLVIVENTTVGSTPEDVAFDREMQFMHEYLFHRLLQDPASHDTELPGNYDTAEGWKERIEALGWDMSFRDSFPMDPHHTVMVFDREMP